MYNLLFRCWLNKFSIANNLDSSMFDITRYDTFYFYLKIYLIFLHDRVKIIQNINLIFFKSNIFLKHTRTWFQIY